MRISVQPAPDQDAHEALAAIEKHMLSIAPFGSLVEISNVDVQSPFVTTQNGWAGAEMEIALADGWGRAPLRLGQGGSIPFNAILADAFPDAEILITGVEDPDTRAHSPNESQHLGVFEPSVLAEALFLARLNDVHLD